MKERLREPNADPIKARLFAPQRKKTRSKGLAMLGCRSVARSLASCRTSCASFFESFTSAMNLMMHTSPSPRRFAKT